MNTNLLTTEARHPESEALDQLSTIDVVRLMNREDARIPPAVGRIAETIARAVDVITDRLESGGRLIYLGAGTSGRLGVLDASECPPTFNSPPWQVVGLIAGGSDALTRSIEGAEDHPEFAIADLQRIELSHQDVLVGIAASGRTPYVIGGLEYARSIGSATIGLTCNDEAALSHVCDFTLAPVVGPEIVSGSTRLKAGTATKLVLNMLSTGAMVKLGKVYGNLMVDLQTTNEKLTDRSRRIVVALTGLPRSEAEDLLLRCDGDVKTAFLVHQRGVSLSTARQLLEHSHGRLREALEREPMTPSGKKCAKEHPLLLGIDGGGSKTLAWLFDAESRDEKPLGVGLSGPSNPLSFGWAAALANIDLAINRAFDAARQPRQQVTAACLAIAGMGREAERRRMETWASQRRLAEHVMVTHDALPVLAAGTATGVGIALIAGTGSLAFGRDEQAATARAGGWGQIIGDVGSGAAIARAGLHAVALAHDGAAPATRMTDALLKELNVATVMDLRDVVTQETFDAQRLAALAPLVIAAAEQGDQPALAIVEQAAHGLAALVLAVSEQLDAGSGNADRELAMAGGVLISSEFLRRRVLEHLSDGQFAPLHVGLVDQPVLGTITLARRLATQFGSTSSQV